MPNSKKRLHFDLCWEIFITVLAVTIATGLVFSSAFALAFCAGIGYSLGFLAACAVGVIYVGLG